MKVKRHVDLPHADLEWFYREYPKASLSWALTMLLHNFRSIHEDVGVTPKRVAKDAAKEFKEQIDEGMFKED